MATQERNVWGIHAGKTGDADGLFLDKKLIALGWQETGSLAKLTADRKTFADHYLSIYPNALAGNVRANASQLYRFVHEMKRGDLVVYPSKVDKQIHIGRIDGDYQFSTESEVAYPHRRAVTWLKGVPRTHFTQGALYETGAAMSIFQVKNFADEFVAAVEGKQPPAPPIKDATVEAVSEDIEQTTADFIKKRLAQQAKGHPFAQFIAHLLQSMGYHTRVSPEGPDHGIDIIAHRDELGIQPPIVKVQCKSSEGSINEETVSAFYGRVAEKEFGLFVALGTYNKGAESYARGRSNLRLIDGDELVELTLEHYERFDSRFKGLLPLKRVYIPEPIEQGEE